jgi:hypothetical protein
MRCGACYLQVEVFQYEGSTLVRCERERPADHWFQWGVTAIVVVGYGKAQSRLAHSLC